MAKTIPNPNQTNKLFGGISGIELLIDKVDLGHGIVLSKTYAHFMAPYIMAFSRAEEGKPHPPPWKAASPGLTFDITAQLFIPKTFAPPSFLNRVNTIWLITSLLRLRATPLAFTPLLTNCEFDKIVTSKKEPSFWPIEVFTKTLIPSLNFPNIIDSEALDWIRTHWERAGWLLCKNKEFYLAFRAFDQSVFNTEAPLALVSLWGGLEILFSPSPIELKFRTSSAISAFLEGLGNKRLETYQRVKKLYDARSKAAHGSDKDATEAFKDTYEIARKVLTKVIEKNHVPKKEELEALLFGCDQ